MKFLRTTLLIIASAMCLSMLGCQGIEPQFYPLGTSWQAGKQRPTNDVEIFITKKPTWQYKELGMITYSTQASFSDEPRIYQLLRAKAGEIGADGIIIMDSQTSIEQTPRITLDFYGNPTETESSRSYIKYRAMAISKIK
jgi:hypothetical protein